MLIGSEKWRKRMKLYVHMRTQQNQKMKMMSWMTISTGEKGQQSAKEPLLGLMMMEMKMMRMRKKEELNEEVCMEEEVYEEVCMEEEVYEEEEDGEIGEYPLVVDEFSSDDSDDDLGPSPDLGDLVDL
jgi:hypothetical protein